MGDTRITRQNVGELELGDLLLIETPDYRAYGAFVRIGRVGIKCGVVVSLRNILDGDKERDEVVTVWLGGKDVKVTFESRLGD